MADGAERRMRTARRAASLWLPRAAAERAARRLAGRGVEEPPLALVADIKQAQRIVGATAAGEAKGARAGQTLADARALAPDLIIRPFDAADRAAFAGALLRWAARYSPWIGPDRATPDPAAAETAPDGGVALALDVTGCAHLFGDEAGLLSDMLGRLDAMGLTARAAIADTKGAAWALARFGRRSAEIAPTGAAAEALAGLPPAALRLDAKTIESLARLGIDRIDALQAQPRAALGRRFGAPALRRLDQAFGRTPEPIAPASPPPHDAVRLSLPEPIGALDDVREGARRLLDRLCDKLAAREVGARRLRLTLRRVDHAEAQIHIGLARPGRDPARILPLFERGLSEVEAGFGVDAMRLEAVVVEPTPTRQPRIAFDPLRPEGADEADALADLLSRLGARVGFDRLTRLKPGESHAPDKAFIVAPAAHSTPARDWPAAAAARPERPLETFSPEPMIIERTAAGDDSSGATGAERPPERFLWRGDACALASARGPERIAPEWWLDDPAWRDGARDYWRLDLANGHALWAFHLPQKPSEPRWFVVGRFA